MSKTILVVEDNALNQRIFKDVLENHSYHVVLNNGLNFMECVESCKPDLILMDIQLPEESGLELVTKLRQHSEYKTIPCIAVTAFAMKGEEIKYFNLGFNSYIQKPCGMGEMLKEVNRFAFN